MRARSAIPGVVVLLLLLVGDVSAQETIDRTPNLAGGWTGISGMLYSSLSSRFFRAAGAINAVPAFELALSVRHGFVGGGVFAPHSSVVAGEPDEWELFGRAGLLRQASGHGVDAAIDVSFNGAASSVDGAATVSRWFGPLRVLGTGRVLSDAFGEGDARVIAGAGAVLHPLPGRAPLGIAADVAAPVDLEDGERAAWSAGLQLGIPYTSHTLSLFATNTATATLHGRSRGDTRTRVGLELTMTIPFGRFAGWYAPREQAQRSVRPDSTPNVNVVRIDIRNYMFAPASIVVAPNTVIEWTNQDVMVHTASSDDNSWGSRGLARGASWRARFSEPGQYPYHCGPHPFMRGIVIVR